MPYAPPTYKLSAQLKSSGHHLPLCKIVAAMRNFGTSVTNTSQSLKRLLRLSDKGDEDIELLQRLVVELGFHDNLSSLGATSIVLTGQDHLLVIPHFLMNLGISISDKPLEPKKQQGLTTDLLKFLNGKRKACPASWWTVLDVTKTRMRYLTDLWKLLP